MQRENVEMQRCRLETPIHIHSYGDGRTRLWRLCCCEIGLTQRHDVVRVQRLCTFFYIKRLLQGLFEDRPFHTTRPAQKCIAIFVCLVGYQDRHAQLLRNQLLHLLTRSTSTEPGNGTCWLGATWATYVNQPLGLPENYEACENSCAHVNCSPTILSRN